MKRSGLGSDNMASLYSGRTYLNSSTKSPLSSYQKALGLNYNSPKSETQKAFAFPQKPYSPSLKVSTKTDKSELILERKNSKGNNDSYSKTPTTIPSYMAPSSSSRPAAKTRGTSTKGTGASPKLYTGLKYSETANQRDSSAKQMRSSNLEINTEIQTFKSTGGLKAYSTKNKDMKDRMQSSAIGITNTNSSLEYSKYSNFGNQTMSGGTKYEYLRTDPAEEKTSQTPSAKQKSALNRILSNTSDKTYSSNSKKTTQFDSNANASSSDNSLKINNFFASAKRKELENSISKKDKSLNISTKNDELSKTTELRRKASPKTTQLEMRSTQKGFAAINTYQTDNADQYEQETYETQEKEEKPAATSQKMSLNSFITKVDKGTALPIKAKREDSEEASRTTGSKTTTNADNKTIVFSRNKLNQQALASSSQEGAKSRGKQGKDSYRDDQEDNLATPNRENIVYYMTSLQKHHRQWTESDYFCQIFKEHFIQTFQALTFCKYLRPVDPKVLAQKKVILPKKPQHKDKKSIIFDLDETLIHCNESAEIPSDVILPIRFPHGEIIEAGINIRPYAIEILKEISQDFEIIIFTASHSCYANVVLDYLDPQNQYISHRLFRDSCVVTDEGIYVKDLRVLGNRSMMDIVLVDNAAYSFGYQIENGIPIAPYYDNKEDVELKHLIPYLKSLKDVKDVREVNKQTFRLQSYSQYDTLDKVLHKVVFAN